MQKNANGWNEVQTSKDAFGVAIVATGNRKEFSNRQQKWRSTFVISGQKKKHRKQKIE